MFAEVFALSPAPTDSADTGKVVLFGHANVDLFKSCCENYGQARGRNRVFSLAQTLFLYAVLLHRIHSTSEFTRRLRVLRNLIEASNNELRLEGMPGLLADVRRLIIEGELEGITSFKQAQVAEERLKVDLLVQEPALACPLFHLEDHRILHGCLAAFELDGGVFERRAQAFHRVFSTEDQQLPLLTGALLAAGDYYRPLNRRFLQFGAVNNDNPWRILLAESDRDDLAATRQALGILLDAVAEHPGDVRSALEGFTQRWLGNKVAAAGLDWRWYFVKYVQMREGSSGIYVGTAGVPSYSMCMLETRNMKGYHRDPYLCAIRTLSGNADAAVQGTVWSDRSDGPWFSGYETVEHWMRLKASGAEIQCTEPGLRLKAPVAAQHLETFSRVCAVHEVDADLLLRVPQVEAKRTPTRHKGSHPAWCRTAARSDIGRDVVFQPVTSIAQLRCVSPNLNLSLFANALSGSGWRCITPN